MDEISIVAVIVIYLGLGIILAYVINGLSNFFYFKRRKILTWDLWWTETWDDISEFYTWWYFLFWPVVWLFIGSGYLKAWIVDRRPGA